MRFGGDDVYYYRVGTMLSKLSGDAVVIAVTMGELNTDTGGECKIELKKAEINTIYKQLEDSPIYICTTTTYMHSQPRRRHPGLEHLYLSYSLCVWNFALLLPNLLI